MGLGANREASDLLSLNLVRLIKPDRFNHKIT